MNGTGQDRLAVIAGVARGELRQAEAALLLGLSVRQVRRVALRYRQEGPAGLLHRLRGRPANNRTSEDVLRQAIQLMATRYADLGPSAATALLAEQEGIVISRETLRQSMIQAGLWEPRRGRVPPAPRSRPQPSVPVLAEAYAWPSP